MKILKLCATAHMLDLDSIVHFLSSYSCEKRMIIIHDLEFEYHYNLIDMVVERPESPIRSCAIAMIVESVELSVRNFHDFLTQKVDDNISRILLEILLGLNNDDIHKFKETYQQLYGNLAEKDINIVQGEQTIVSDLLIQLLEGKRYDDSSTSATSAKHVAKGLHGTTSDTSIIDNDTLIKVFTRYSFSQLSSIFDIYEDRYGETILQAIQRRFQNPIEIQCFQDMIEFTRSPGVYYSRLLRQALGETPIDYITLIRIIIGREEKDLGEIKLEYSKMCDQTLDETIKERLDNLEIKRLLVMIITNGEDITADHGPVRFDNANNSNSTYSGVNSTTSHIQHTGRRLSHEAFDKFINVFKIMRSH